MRKDDAVRQNHIEKSIELIYKHGRIVNSKAVERLMQPESDVPIKVTQTDSELSM